jgi:DNA-binding NtrC family response regulator
MARVLLVDDDPQALDSTKRILEFAGHAVTTATDGQAALDQVRSGTDKFDLVVSDVRMPRLGGLEFLRALSLCGGDIPVILMTAFGRVEDAVWAMKFGAVDFLTKPFKRQAFLAAVDSAIKRSKHRQSAVDQQAGEASSDTLIGNSEPMRKLRALIEQVAPTAATILVNGESGTGKELVARCIHRLSNRGSKRYIAINCAAVPEQLIESELFGFEKGAFTGATGAKEGLFEAADHGTLLLDEIGDMPFPLQAKLLRVLQESEVRRLGATVPRKIDVRLIAATHQNLQEKVKDGSFRQDLLFRLEVIVLNVPPLRERLDDVPEMAYHFLKQSSKRHEKTVSGISPAALEALRSYCWPGNVRELSNVIERAVIFAGQGEVGVEDLPPHIISGKLKQTTPGGSISVKLGTPLKDVEEMLIKMTLEATQGDKNMTAKLLGINSRTIYRKLDKGTEPGEE